MMGVHSTGTGVSLPPEIQVLVVSSFLLLSAVINLRYHTFIVTNEYIS
jgi:hypothetical protein